MTETAAQRLSRLRGSLPPEEPGARGLERVGRNPACQRLRAMTMVGISPSTAVAEIFGDALQEGQSPFAILTGNKFEAFLFESGAARLLDLYRRANRLAPAECKVINVEETAPEATDLNLHRRAALTRKLLRMKASGDPQAPNLIIKPRIAVNLIGEGHFVVPDALVASDGDRVYRPVEVKSYPDRAGKTDPADIRSACRQAAVGAVAIRQELMLQKIGVSYLEQPVCDLILRQPGSFGATLRSMPIEGEVDSLERIINEAPRNIDELEDLLSSIGQGAALSDSSVLDAIPNNYIPSCREHCALAKRCKQQSIASGDPVLIGLRAREVFAAAGSIGRVIELLDGAGRLPRTQAEHLLREELREADAVFKEAIGYGA